jgi:HEPN domain-containing protein
MNAFDLANEWLKFSKSDLLTSRHMFEDVYPKEIEIVCYHSQQCAEKALKGYCVFKGIEPPNTHDLIALCHLCMTSEDTFSLLMDNCSRLNPYGVIIRYPNELVVDETIAKSSIAMAQKIYEFCHSKIQKLEHQ